jgi:hypothetical protein
MQAIANAIGWVLDKIVGAIAWIGELFVAVFVALWDILRDVFTWVFEQVLDVAVIALEAVDTSSLAGAGSAWGSLPGKTIEVMSAIGVTQALTLIVAALGIRLVLQLIPFTRLGS